MPSIDTPQTQRANRRFIEAAMTSPMLESETELELARRWRDDDDAKALHALTMAYMRLVVAIASRFRNYGLPIGDLIQEGNVGLMQAAARFEPEREVRFSTYASWWIRSCIQDYVLRNWSVVRTGTTSAQKSLFFNLRRLRARIGGNPDGKLKDEERSQIAHWLKVDVSDVEAMEARFAAHDRSLNMTIGQQGDDEWLDLLPDDRPHPEAAVIATRDNEKRSRWIKRALRALNPRELTIIRERRLQDQAATLEALGQRLGISKERVRQIEHQALTKLKTALLSDIGDPVEAGFIAAH